MLPRLNVFGPVAQRDRTAVVNTSCCKLDCDAVAAFIALLQWMLFSLMLSGSCARRNPRDRSPANAVQKMSERIKWVTRPRKLHKYDGLRERIQRAAPQSTVSCVGQMYDNGLELHVKPGAKTNDEADNIKMAASSAGYEAVWFNNESGVTIIHAWAKNQLCVFWIRNTPCGIVFRV